MRNVNIKLYIFIFLNYDFTEKYGFESLVKKVETFFQILNVMRGMIFAAVDVI